MCFDIGDVILSTMINYSLNYSTNQLPILKLPMMGVDSVTVLVLVNTGSRYETKSQQGIAHFFEHMVFKGTEKYPTAQLLARTVDGVGADFNAFTSKEYTGYYVKSASKHLPLAIDVLSDMLLTPSLKQEDIDREKGVIIEELNMYVDSPSNHISNLFDRMIFKDSGLGHDIIGTKETINSFSSQDFRDFLHDWYGHKNMVLVLAGNSSVVESEETMKLINDNFAKKSGERVNKRIDLASFLSEKPVSEEKLHLEYRDTQQAHLVMGWPAVKRNSPERYAISLLGIMMGGNMSSRLFSEVREKRGLCYYINSGVDQFHDGGVLETSAGVDPARVEEAIKVIKDEYYSVLDGKNTFTQEELQRAKEYVIGKMILSYEDSESVAQHFGMKYVLLGKVETPEEVMKKIKEVKIEEVLEIAKKVIKQNELRMAVIGPYKHREMFEKLID